MDSARYLLVFGVIFALLCGIAPVSGYVDAEFLEDFSSGSVSETWNLYQSDSTVSVSNGICSITTSAGSFSQRYRWYVYPTALTAPYTIEMRMESTTDNTHALFGLFESSSGQTYDMSTRKGFHVITRWNNEIRIGYYDTAWRNLATITGITSGEFHTIILEVDENRDVYYSIDGSTRVKHGSKAPSTAYPYFGQGTFATAAATTRYDYIHINKPEIDTPIYDVTIFFKDLSGNNVNDVYYQVADLKPTVEYPYGQVLYTGYTLGNSITLGLEERVLNQGDYRIVGKKQGYYDGDITLTSVLSDTTVTVNMQKGEEHLIYQTYPVTVNFRHQHDYSLVTDVYYLIGDLKPSPGYPYGKTLYSGWSDTGTINIELEHRSMDDPNFPQQYRIVGKKYGYYDGEVIVSHLTYPYTFNVIMEDSSVTPTINTALIDFWILERFTDSFINEATLKITDLETSAVVYNETVYGGKKAIRLNQTQPGYAYPHYKIEISSTGYVDYVSYIHTLSVDGIHRARMTAISTPLDPGNILLHVYTVREDNNGNTINIPNVKVTISGEQKITNSAGYTVFEVGKNATYQYTAEHANYATSRGSIVIYEDERFLHIWMQSPGAIQPTPTPTIPPTPSPDDESYIDWMVRNFATAFNLSLEGGKLFMGMIISLAIGMVTAKKLNGGAAEFGIGMLGGMVLCILIGILPLWPIIALLLIVGLYIGMQIARGDKQGGR